MTSVLTTPKPGKPAQAAARGGGRVQRRSRQVGLMLLIPTIALIGYALIYPLVTVSTTAFESGSQDFKWAIETEANIRSLKHSFYVAFLVTVLCAVIAYPYAYMMARAQRRSTVLLMTVVVLVPFWTSALVRSFAWVVALDDKGAVNWGADFLGLGPWKMVPSSVAVIIAMVQVMLPFMILPIFSSMKNVDQRLRLAAIGLGARPSVAFLKTDLQLSLPGCFAGSILVFVIALGFYITPALLGSPDDSMISILIAVQVDRLLDWGRASALALVLLVSTLAILAVAAIARKLLFSGVGRETRGGWL